MNNFFWIVLFISIIAAVVGLIWYFKRRRIQNSRAKKIAGLPIDYPTAIPYIYHRPETPYISSVVPVPEEAIQAVTEGLKQTIRSVRHRFPHWKNALQPSDYNILFIQPAAVNQDGSPALLVKVRGIDGSVIDRIQSAGTVIGLPGQYVAPPNIVLPHQSDQNWQYLDYLKNSARFEGEHFVELLNDLAVFYQYVGANDIHPHHPDPEQSEDLIRGFAALRRPHFSCGVRKVK